MVDGLTTIKSPEDSVVSYVVSFAFTAAGGGAKMVDSL